MSALADQLAALHEAPWRTAAWGGGHGGWEGRVQSIDGTPTSPFAETDVVRVVAYGCTSPGWDGESCAIVELADGRFAGWESSWGPTGAGFSRDAYGGDAVVLFAASAELILAQLSERVKELFV